MTAPKHAKPAAKPKSKVTVTAKHPSPKPAKKAGKVTATNPPPPRSISFSFTSEPDPNAALLVAAQGALLAGAAMAARRSLDGCGSPEAHVALLDSATDAFLAVTGGVE